MGNLIKTIPMVGSDMFQSHYEMSCGKARKAVFAIQKKLRKLKTIPTSCKFYLFNSLVNPILLHGSEVWATSKTAAKTIDKFFIWFAKYVLNVKQSTSTDIVIGECGQIPPSVLGHIRLLNYCERLRKLPNENVTKIVFDEMKNLHELGFKTWYTRASELAKSYNLKIGQINSINSKSYVKTTILLQYKNKWSNSVRSMKFYSSIKNDFHLETYLDIVKEPHFRNAITKLRTSSHALEVERGRYTKPKTPLDMRLCENCNIVEDEIHFICSCDSYSDARNDLYSRVKKVNDNFGNLSDRDKFVYLFTTENQECLTLLGKFIFKALCIREERSSNR